ncbi:hypothetical protein NDU88_002772 [Pleurodeles waltl]|uniref:Secreted protein n=1 Tax=Pleurodeles waltl TaxID=8319 RepID=A0AAV7UWL1_PLEWA|nr:hypothetical protein NDU88_002772 [Pleurodeles waltl]
MFCGPLVSVSLYMGCFLQALRGSSSRPRTDVGPLRLSEDGLCRPSLALPKWQSEAQIPHGGMRTKSKPNTAAATRSRERRRDARTPGRHLSTKMTAPTTRKKKNWVEQHQV